VNGIELARDLALASAAREDMGQDIKDKQVALQGERSKEGGGQRSADDVIGMAQRTTHRTRKGRVKAKGNEQ
jgi:hypothetical protein